MNPARDHVLLGQERHDVGRPHDWLDPQTVTVTQLLRDAGYATGHFGKWHLGGGDGAPTPDAYGIDDVRALVTLGIWSGRVLTSETGC